MAKTVQQTYHVAEFQNADKKFIAFGRDDMMLPVYLLDGNTYKRVESMFYPACLKFMPDADIKPERRATMKQIRKSYPLG